MHKNYSPAAVFSGSSDISIACNNLAQKYLFAGGGGFIPSSFSEQLQPRYKILPSRGQTDSFYGGGQDNGGSGFSIATQNYLERHRLTERKTGGIGGQGRLYSESIIEACNEDEDEQRQQTDGGSSQGLFSGQHHNALPRSQQQALMQRAKDDAPSRPKLVVLDFEQLRNLPKLPPRKSTSPL